MVNSDFRDLLSEFNAHGVEFLVVGAHPLAAHGHVRATKDLDIWIRPNASNAPRVLRALQAYGGTKPKNSLMRALTRKGMKSCEGLARSLFEG